MDEEDNQQEADNVSVGVHDTFDPKDMRVLAIDADAASLKFLVGILEKCEYQVTSTTVAAEALRILRENKDEHDIVITDVIRLDMDGFELLEIIGLEMDIPVIVVSSEDSKSSIVRGIRHGARDYLLKPVRMQEIRNIWQHVFRKRVHDSPDKSSITRELLVDQDSMPSRRTKPDVKDQEPDEDVQWDHHQCHDNGTSKEKKPRVAWSPELHSRFLDAIQLLEARGEKVIPKRIREIMNVNGVNRENIASHLQKYRNNMKKPKAESEEGDPGIDLTKYNVNPTIISGSNARNTLLDMKQNCLRTRKADIFGQNNIPCPPNLLMRHQMINHLHTNTLSSQLAIGNHTFVPQLKGLNSVAPNTGWRLPNEYMAMSSRLFGQEPGRVHKTPPSLCSASTSSDPIPQILGNGSAELDEALLLLPPVVGDGPNSIIGQCEGGSSASLYDIGNAEHFIGQTNPCPNWIQSSVMADIATDDEAQLFVDDEISEIIKQFNSDGAPSL